MAPDTDFISRKRTVLITGCSAGGIGDALAQAFHATGQTRVFATARNLSKLSHFQALGIEILQLDVESEASIRGCVVKLGEATGGALDILVNNSGAGYNMPLSDANIDAARSLFNLNVLSVLAVTQAFIPALLKSASSGRDPIIINNTSIVSVIPMPFMGIYNASKAAIASMTDTLRLELSLHGIGVIDLKTGTVRSNFQDNLNKSGESKGPKLPTDSIFTPAREVVEDRMSGAHLVEAGVPADQFAKSVVAVILKNPQNPPAQLWKGASAWLVWFVRRFLPFTYMDGDMKKLGRMQEVKQLIEAARQKR